MKAKRIGIAIIRNKYGIKSEYCQYLISQVNNLENFALQYGIEAGK